MSPMSCIPKLRKKNTPLFNEDLAPVEQKKLQYENKRLKVKKTSSFKDTSKPSVAEPSAVP